MAVLDIISAFAVSVLAGLGIGGGGLMVLYLTFVSKYPQAEAQGLNIIFFLAASSGAFIVNWKKRRFEWKRICAIMLSGMIAAAGGAFLASALSNSLLRRLFGGLLIISGTSAFFWKEKQ